MPKLQSPEHYTSGEVCFWKKDYIADATYINFVWHLGTGSMLIHEKKRHFRILT
jgi:hypothetical protein